MMLWIDKKQRRRLATLSVFFPRRFQPDLTRFIFAMRCRGDVRPIVGGKRRRRLRLCQGSCPEQQNDHVFEHGNSSNYRMRKEPTTAAESSTKKFNRRE